MLEEFAALEQGLTLGESVTRGCDLTLEMSTDPAWRAAHGCVSDYNVYAANAWTPFMRHNWNDNNTLPQWRQRFVLDEHSRLATVDYQRLGAGFRLLSKDGLDVAGPLPEAVTKVWKPRNAKRVGADMTQWP